MTYFHLQTYTVPNSYIYCGFFLIDVHKRKSFSALKLTKYKQTITFIPVWVCTIGFCLQNYRYFGIIIKPLFTKAFRFKAICVFHDRHFYVLSALLKAQRKNFLIIIQWWIKRKLLIWQKGEIWKEQLNNKFRERTLLKLPGTSFSSTVQRN